MTAKAPAPSGFQRPWEGSILIGAAGFVDSVGFLMLSHMFVANMSGNTVALGVNLARRHWGEVLARASPVVTFVPGLIVGAMIVAVAKRLNLRSCLAPALAIEALFLVLFLLLGLRWAGNWGTLSVTDGYGYPVLIGFAALAMGIQNGALRRVGALRNVHTYVTGMLLASAEGLTDFIFWVGSSSRHRQCGRSLRACWSQPGLRKALVAGGYWCSYLVGAVLGGSALLAYGLMVMLAPLLVLAIMIIIEIFRPAHPGTSIAVAESGSGKDEYY